MSLVKEKTHLVQTVVKLSVLRKLDGLAKATGHKRASYLRHLIEVHVDDEEWLGSALSENLHPDDQQKS
jgi:hypothetical protein